MHSHGSAEMTSEIRERRRDLKKNNENEIIAVHYWVLPLIFASNLRKVLCNIIYTIVFQPSLMVWSEVLKF